jgi:ribosome biogenesis GTPase A
VERDRNIHWYPGHMAKAKRLISESVAQVDIIVEVLDARLPLSSRNADFDALFASKKRLIVLNKSDLADERATASFEAYYRELGFVVCSFCSVRGSNKKALAGIEQAAAEVVEKYRAKGIKKTVRALVAGIPNVGKSAFINALSRGARAKTGDRPGVTRGKQWVKVSPFLELLDTPGVLWPKLENQQFARRLAYAGCIKDDILNRVALAADLLAELHERYGGRIAQTYGIQERADGQEMLLSICEQRGFLLPGAELDTERGAQIVLDEFRAGKLGRITLDKVVEA